MGLKRIFCAALAMMLLLSFCPEKVSAVKAQANARNYVDRYINGGGVELGLYKAPDQDAISTYDVEGRYEIPHDDKTDSMAMMYTIDMYNIKDHYDIGDECGYVNYYYGGAAQYSALLYMVDTNTYLIFDPDSMEGYRDSDMTFLQMKFVDGNYVIDIYRSSEYKYSYVMVEHYAY